MLSTSEQSEQTVSDLAQFFHSVRQETQHICAPLETEDYGIQTMPDVSPAKWHLAHTSWFFETFLLKPFLDGYHEFHAQFAHLFNSYYEQAGTFHPRAERGLLSRPTVKDVYAYRQHVTEAMQRLLDQHQHHAINEIHRRCEIGIHHEQQHQELLYTDIKHIFAYNPLQPVYRNLPLADPQPEVDDAAMAPAWLEQPGGVYRIGHQGAGFAYDNESPQHKVYLEPFRIAARLTTNRAYLSFMQDDGYRRPALWLSDGWKTVKTRNWQHPLYWQLHDGQWFEFTLGGLRELDLDAPVSHVSFYEANAYANWRNQRLATEAEWEVLALQQAVKGNLREDGYLHPVAAPLAQSTQCYGDVWEWTQSSYSPYPGYRTDDGALGEYNGKFMSSQMVLRGGSCVTPSSHIRASYRNFFYPGDRWQFSGIRLAETL